MIPCVITLLRDHKFWGKHLKERKKEGQSLNFYWGLKISGTLQKRFHPKGSDPVFRLSGSPASTRNYDHRGSILWQMWTVREAWTWVKVASITIKITDYVQLLILMIFTQLTRYSASLLLVYRYSLWSTQWVFSPVLTQRRKRTWWGHHLARTVGGSRFAWVSCFRMAPGLLPPRDPLGHVRREAVEGGQGACPWSAGVTRGARKSQGEEAEPTSELVAPLVRLSDGRSRRFCVCVFLSGICLAMGHMIHSVNIYHAIIHFPGTFSSQCQPGPMDSHSNIPKALIPFFKVYCQFSAAWLLCWLNWYYNWGQTFTL